MNWNIKSKRFLVVLFASGIYVATLAVNPDLFRFVTPYVFAFWAAYMGFESWRPSGVSWGADRLTTGGGSPVATPPGETPAEG